MTHKLVPSADLPLDPSKEFILRVKKRLEAFQGDLIRVLEDEIYEIRAGVREQLENCCGN